ncbi:MAG: hypothetical protein KDD21_03150, partial [Bacteroidetes bacterium]|nr:hypothetical protein [Bacteroidota bacterium]
FFRKENEAKNEISFYKEMTFNHKSGNSGIVVKRVTRPVVGGEAKSFSRKWESQYKVCLKFPFTRKGHLL